MQVPLGVVHLAFAALHGRGDCSGINLTATKALESQELADRPALSIRRNLQRSSGSRDGNTAQAVRASGGDPQ